MATKTAAKSDKTQTAKSKAAARPAQAKSGAAPAIAERSKDAEKPVFGKASPKKIPADGTIRQDVGDVQSSFATRILRSIGNVASYAIGRGRGTKKQKRA